MSIWRGDTCLGPATAQQRSVLAALLLNPGWVVSVDRLVEVVWGDDPPVSARNAIQVYVSRLRRLLTRVDGADLVTVPPGYRLDVDPMRIDLYRFRDLVGQARESGPDAAGALLRQALRLWNGPPLADVAGRWLHETFAAALIEERLTAVEDRLALDVRSGRRREALAELPVLMSEHPLRERPAYLTMTALELESRRADALEVYRTARQRLVEELGIEPGEELQLLHQRILREELVAGSPDAGDTGERMPPVPAELPADMPTFTGRTHEAAQLRQLLGAAGGPATICQISGIGGVGKSALAIHVARTVADRFPDGRLYVNLHGSTPRVAPVEPVDALGRLLRSLGVAGSAVPADLEEAAGRFRSLTEGMRMLVMLDNARDAAQVRPLLPGSSSCAVLITSRRSLSSLEGSTQIPLDVLSHEDGTALLDGLLGADRIAAEPAAAAEVVRLCGGLPLALCLAAARLAARPAWPVSALADRMSVARRRLDELRADDREVRASFQCGYQDLAAGARGQPAARMFRLLGLLDGHDFNVPVAAALAGLPDDHARDLLDRLVEVQLVENHTADRYRLHDLLRLFARERAAEEEDEPARQRAVRGALHSHLASARTAIRILKAGSWRLGLGPAVVTHHGAALETSEDVHAWIDAEEDNILAAVEQAQRTSEPGLGVALAVTFAIPLYERGRWAKQLALGELGLRAAEHTGDVAQRAHAHGDVGWAKHCLGRMSEATGHLRQALSAYREIGDRPREAALLDNLGAVSRAMGRLDEAIGYHRRSTELHRHRGDRYGEAAGLSHLGLAYQRVGRFEEAVELHHRALALLREVGAAPVDLVPVIVHLAEAYRVAGMPGEAVTHYRHALDVYVNVGHGRDYREAEISWGLGLALHDTGEHEQARRLWRRSGVTLHRLGLISAGERNTIETSASPGTPDVIQRQL